jgi:hypothetical protein
LWSLIVKEFGNQLFIFQDDNITPHVSRQISAWKDENRIPKCTWPAQSPNPNITGTLASCTRLGELEMHKLGRNVSDKYNIW